MTQKIKIKDEDLSSREQLDRAVEFLSDSQALENIAINYADLSLQKKGQGYFGAYLEAINKGHEHIKLTSKDIYQWNTWIFLELRENLKGKKINLQTVTENQNLSSLNSFVNELKQRLDQAGFLADSFQIVQLMGDSYLQFISIPAFDATKRQICRLILNYIAAWFKVPTIVIRTKEKADFDSAHKSKNAMYSFLGKKIQEAVYNQEMRLLELDEDYDFSAVYRNPSVQGQTIVEWHALRKALENCNSE